MGRCGQIKKPLICQAGSAEAFVGSAAAGREHYKYTSSVGKSKTLFKEV